MENPQLHSFHIPVLGLAFSIDTPIRVARFGITSVISIVDDILIEHMRKYYALLHNESYRAITVMDEDYRARRITAYLNLVQKIVQKQFAALKASAFEKGNEIVKYFEMLPEQSPLKTLYRRMTNTQDAGQRLTLQNEIRTKMLPGSIDVNIMTKIDNLVAAQNGTQIKSESSPALASLRGFAESDLNSSVVLSAGLNPRLFSYIAQRPEFLPDDHGRFDKKIILKVTDYRSALIQGKLLTKKGVWVSEFRIESGLNCGGHAFASDGYLLGPILEKFKTNRDELFQELEQLYAASLHEKGVPLPSSLPYRITVQGGIGTANEDSFLRKYYEVDGTGWGSPFLLVPEATNVDDTTRNILSCSKKNDYYISDSSPLGVAFNNIKGSTSNLQIQQRVSDGRPGSKCTKKFLVSNTEFTAEPICVASSRYQELKIDELKKQNLPADIYREKHARIIEKTCLCEDLAAAGIINTNGHEPANNRAVAVCPGPNLAYFSKIASLEEMIGHIYGRLQLLTDTNRPNLFINELRLYIDYMKSEMQKKFDSWSTKEQNHFDSFKKNLQEGIAYYRSLIPRLLEETERYRERMREDLLALEQELLAVIIPAAVA